MKVFPLFCVATGTCRHNTERGPHRVKQFVSYSLMFCQSKKRQLSYFCITESHPFAKFWHVWLPTHLDKKGLHTLQTESQSINWCFFNGKLLVAR